MPAPANYQPIIDPSRKLMATPMTSATPFYAIPEESDQLKKDMPAVPEGLPELKPEDVQFFSKLLQVRRRAPRAPLSRALSRGEAGVRFALRARDDWTGPVPSCAPVPPRLPARAGGTAGAGRGDVGPRRHAAARMTCSLGGLVLTSRAARRVACVGGGRRTWTRRS